MRWFAPLLALTSVVFACGPAPEPRVASEQREATVSKARDPGADHEVRARLAKERGVLDVAAEELRLAYEKNKTPATKRAWGEALADAWAFEAARAALADFPDALAKLPPVDTTHVLEPVVPDADRIDRVLAALAHHDGKGAHEELAPLVTPRASPLVLELVGRARLAMNEPIEARRAFARARSRIDAADGKIGMVASAAGSVESLALRSGHILVAGRTRERYLVGGYQSNGTHSVWVESYAIGDADPLVRFPTGHLAGGVAMSADGHTFALADTPISDDIVFSGAQNVQSARIFDARTGHESSNFPVSNVRHVAFAGLESLLLGEDKEVVATSFIGRNSRTYAITGTTPTVMYAMRTNGQDDAVPTTYPSQPATMAAAANGTVAVGASDGAIWIWPTGNKPSYVLKPLPPPASPPPQPGVPHEIGKHAQPLAMQFDAASANILVASTDGAVTSWDLATKKSRVLVQPKCTEQELANGVWGSGVTPQLLAQCAEARTAALSPDGSRVVFASLMGGPRVRDVKTGDALSMLDTLAADAIVFDDPAGTTSWMGGVDGTIEHWNTTTGERTDALAQGGIGGFVQSISSDGQYVVVMTSASGYRHTAQPQVKVWDTTAHAAVAGFPADLTRVRFVSGSLADVSTRTHGSFLFDLATNKRSFDLAPDEWNLVASESRDRFVSVRARQKIVVRDTRGVLREIDAAAHLDITAIDRNARVVAAITDKTELAVWSTDDGRELFRIPAARGSLLAVSPEGRAVVWRSDAKTLVVTATDDHHEIARITSKEISPAQDYGSIRSAVFTSETELLVIGPGEPGFQRVYRWTIDGGVKPTELQVLSGDRIEVSATTGIATIYDRNDAAFLLRAKDGALLASIYAARSGGWMAMSREGAVDASPDGHSVVLTSVTGALAGGSSWLGWDRFEAPDLLARAERGEIAVPPMRGVMALSTTLRQQATR